MNGLLYILTTTPAGIFITGEEILASHILPIIQVEIDEETIFTLWDTRSTCSVDELRDGRFQFRLVQGGIEIRAHLGGLPVFGYVYEHVITFQEGINIFLQLVLAGVSITSDYDEHGVKMIYHE
jgi:hypothetical protein